jgi:hypothetical protein
MVKVGDQYSNHLLIIVRKLEPFWWIRVTKQKNVKFSTIQQRSIPNFNE